MTPTEPGYYWAKAHPDAQLEVVRVDFNPYPGSREECPALVWRHGCDDYNTLAEFTDWQRIYPPPLLLCKMTPEIAALTPRIGKGAE